jgi:PAS domain S-box-containing protein
LRWARPNRRWSEILTTFQPDATDAISIAICYGEVRSMRRSEEQMRRLVECSAQRIIVPTQTDVLFMNDAFARLLGFASPRECIAGYSSVNESIHPDDLPLVLKHLAARIRGAEAVSHYEFRLLHRNGSPLWVETHAANVVWNGSPASLSWLSDISGRKAIQDEHVRSRNAAQYANRTKTQFLANMSHELRTPLNAILGFSEMIEREIYGPINPKFIGYAGDIHRSGNLLLALVNDVLDLAKREAGKLELRESDLSIPDLIGECVSLVRERAKKAGLKILCDLPVALPRLRADERVVKQLLLNSLSNALKFTPEGGRVTVDACADPRSGYRLVVSDTGIGMSSLEIEIALSPFAQIDSKLARKHEGTGPGLPICRSLMELHGGELSVKSAPNARTTLTAQFPSSRIVIPDRVRLACQSSSAKSGNQVSIANRDRSAKWTR